MLPDSFNLSLLHYGHSGPFVRRLTDRFDATKMTEAVQLGEMSCGCWVVLDGNTRIAAILRHDPAASIAVLPRKSVMFLRHGEWDESLLKWWNPHPQTFGFVQQHSAELYRARRNKRSYASLETYEAEIARLMRILEKTPHGCI